MIAERELKMIHLERTQKWQQKKNIEWEQKRTIEWQHKRPQSGNRNFDLESYQKENRKKLRMIAEEKAQNDSRKRSQNSSRKRDLG